ncbi:MAG: serine/threonine-protein kinase [Armatimonadota bacterium]|nr:serine/threonine protein kinase [Armatimonadota bacterium]MCX7777479.1 serine/threonine protein kinase [Armatimonadota bacterium]MDW8025512.1 serine/threonine-protein kinase [Armatimonadota bacterium]
MQMCPECSADNLSGAVNCSRCGAQLKGLLGSGTLLNNRYRVIKVLGCGGMGAVYLAEDLALYGRKVAIKENFDTSQEGRKQFEIEARILATLSHPNLPKVFDFFTAGGKQYVAMDYIAGEDLLNHVEQNGPQGLEEALKWFWQVCDAVEYLHRQSPPVIHRDIKPGNIKIQPDGRAVLVDFGIAKFYRPGQQTTSGAQAVTPGFSPIEQYGKGITDQRSDVYSLAATLYFALTGVTPPEAVERLTHNRRLISIRSINPDVTEAVERVIEKALKLHPSERYTSVREFSEALRMAIAQPAQSAYRWGSYPHSGHRMPTSQRGAQRRGGWQTPQHPIPYPTQSADPSGCLFQLFEVLFWLIIAWSFGCCVTAFIIYLLTALGLVWSSGTFIVTGNPLPLLFFALWVLILLRMTRMMNAARRRQRKRP